MAFNRTYDQRYQVTRMNGGSSDRRYTRDKNGRVTGIANVRTPSLAGLNATLDYATENNRLQSVIGANAGTYIYDANGNTLSDGRHAFTYDALNRLTAVSANNTVLATYTYDVWTRRTSKTAGGRTIHYHYDQDSRLIGESLANGTVLREYVYLRGEPVALLEYETRPGWYFYVTDHLGTPQQLVDSRGAVVWQAAYLPYGEARVLKATVQNNLRFPGQYFDAETSLHYNWNRYYNPKTGRYITADPIGLAGGMNLYAYVGGNPVNNIDPTGEILVPLAVGTGIVLSVGSVWIFKDCLERCTGKKCGETDKEPKNLAWCAQYCLGLANLTAIGSSPVIGTATEIGTQVGNSRSK